MSFLPLWALWLVVALAAAIGEITSMTLFLALVAMAAVVTALVAVVLPAAIGIQIVVFAALSLVGIAVFRPILVGTLGVTGATHISGPVSQTHIVNRRATVTRTVDSAGGQIRIGEGEFWSARTFEPSDVLLPGTKVEVVLVEGLTALVIPVAQQALESQASVQKGTPS